MTHNSNQSVIPAKGEFMFGFLMRTFEDDNRQNMGGYAMSANISLRSAELSWHSSLSLFSNWDYTDVLQHYC